VKTLTGLVAIILVAALTCGASAEKSPSGPKDVERLLQGEWKGLGPCEGSLTLKPDGSYQRIHRGPAGDNSSGTWEMKWDALPPKLVLKCDTADLPLYVRTEEVKLLELGDRWLVFQYPQVKTSPSRFERATVEKKSGQ
jgi:hypothetical protein